MVAAPVENPARRISSVPTTTPEVIGDRSVQRRTAMLSSLMLADSDRLVPTHSHPLRIASGLNESRSTVLPTPRSPVSTTFSTIVR